MTLESHVKRAEELVIELDAAAKKAALNLVKELKADCHTYADLEKKLNFVKRAVSWSRATAHSRIFEQLLFSAADAIICEEKNGLPISKSEYGGGEKIG